MEENKLEFFSFLRFKCEAFLSFSLSLSLSYLSWWNRTNHKWMKTVNFHFKSPHSSRMWTRTEKNQITFIMVDADFLVKWKNHKNFPSILKISSMKHGRECEINEPILQTWLWNCNFSHHFVTSSTTLKVKVQNVLVTFSQAQLKIISVVCKTNCSNPFVPEFNRAK